MKLQLLSFLIDDDLDDQEIFSVALKEAYPTMQCVFANDGLKALDKLTNDLSFVPDFIFIDINMPRMDGIQCLTELKKLPHLAAIPVYMYSTSAEPQTVVQCKHLGATDFVQKVSDIRKLEEILKKVFQTL